MKAILPNFFSFKSSSDLVRIGNNYDGGYLASQSDIEKSDLLIGMGISDDWSFEEDFIKIKELEVYAYDASVSFKYFLREFLKSIIRIDKPSIALKNLKVLLNYRNFFSQKNVHHIEKFVGLNSLNNAHCTFLDVLSETNSQNIFLKIDIEGSEYRFLKDLIANSRRINGLVMECHDCDLHLEEIKEFIKDFGLDLVHIHANNYAPIRLDDGLPLVMELTFSKFSKISQSSELPHKLDMPNDKNEAEIKLVIGE
jgi:hypothetical protein